MRNKIKYILILSFSLFTFLSFAQKGTLGCASGGPGSESCSVEGEIMGQSRKMSVKCGEGYYACCSLLGGAKCKAEEPKTISGS